MPVTNAVEARDLARHYTMGQTVVRALDGVSLDIARGEFLALLGTSGSGKSTLLNLIAGLDRPTAGTLKVFDNDLAAMSRESLSLHRRRKVGIIFQSFNLIATMTALENVTLAMMFAEVPRREREERGRTLLEQVGLGGRHAHRPAELSGGEQQRVSIARALANDPDILLADEPTGNLDSHTARDIVGLLEQLNVGRRQTTAAGAEPPGGRTIVLVTHDAALAACCARRTVTLLDGRIVGERAS